MLRNLASQPELETPKMIGAVVAADWHRHSYRYTTPAWTPLSPVYVAFYGVCRGHVNVNTAATVVAFEPPPTEHDYLFLLSVLTAISIRPSLASLSGKPLMAWIAWLA